MFKNLIDGEWVAGARVSNNINPSDTHDVLGSRKQGRYVVEFYTTVKTAYTQA
jgi:hypothetical protein